MSEQQITSKYEVIKKFKGDGVMYEVGDEYVPTGGPFEHKLVGRYIIPSNRDELVNASRHTLAKRRAEALHRHDEPEQAPAPEGHPCEQCDFIARNAGGLTSHMRAKHQEGE